MFKLMSRNASFSAIGTLLIGLGLPLTATAQPSYPSRPVAVVVTMAPGGTTDIVGRLVAQKLQERMGGLYGCLPAIGANPHRVVKKSAAALYPALFVVCSGYPA